jgi:predicted nucleotidyltransferase component of viral defense system
MTFHQEEDFRDAILKTAEHFKIRDLLIEKDYWAMYVLRNLSFSPYKDQVVFKGGTSLSKAYHCIDRFSEDIDLAILKDGNINDNQLKKLLKAIEKEITVGVVLIDGHPSEEKRGRNRKTFYSYPKVLPDQSFENVKEELQVEINSLTHPIPFQKCTIETYITQFFREQEFQELIEKHSLQPFELNVLSRERTFFEKLSSLIRLSYDGNDALKKKIRHFYDLSRLQQQEDLKENLLTIKSFDLLTSVIEDDRHNNTFKGEWLQHPLSASPLFQNLDENWKELKSTYEKELSDLSFSGNIPKPDEIRTLFKEIKKFLIEYDEKSSQ